MTRPRPSAFGKRLWQRMPSSVNDNCARTCACCMDGNTSIMRLIVETAELVCKVANVKWPVSAMRNADSMFRDRAFRRPARQDLTQGGAKPRRIPWCRHFTALIRCGFVVMEKFNRVFDRQDMLMTLSIDLVITTAKVVDFPEPRGASDRRSPLASCKVPATAGSPSSSNDLISYGIARAA